MDKEALRREVAVRLDNLRPSTRALEEELMFALVQTLPEWSAARTVALYHAKPPEIATVGLTLAAWRTGKATVFPRVDGADLAFHVVDSWSQLRPGKFGISEPVDCPRVAVGEIDLVIVPGVAFDAFGGRLGRGGGYYDRFLAEIAAPKVGVCFSTQLVDKVPVERHDVAVNIVAVGDGEARRINLEH